MNRQFYGYYWRDAKGDLQPLYAPAYHVIATSCIPRVPCIVHRRQDRKTGWQVTHIKTGLCVATGATKRQAANEALKMIHWFGEDAIYRSENP